IGGLRTLEDFVNKECGSLVKLRQVGIHGDQTSCCRDFSATRHVCDPVFGCEFYKDVPIRIKERLHDHCLGLCLANTANALRNSLGPPISIGSNCSPAVEAAKPRAASRDPLPIYVEAARVSDVTRSIEVIAASQRDRTGKVSFGSWPCDDAE